MRWLDENASGPVVLDDPGNEPDAKHFGSSFPLATIISQRYELWRRKPECFTVITANTKRADREAMFGARAADRMDEMFLSIKCAWPSYRSRDKGGEV